MAKRTYPASVLLVPVIEVSRKKTKVSITKEIIATNFGGKLFHATLIFVNCASLTDMKSVIGDELYAIMEAREKRNQTGFTPRIDFLANLYVQLFPRESLNDYLLLKHHFADKLSKRLKVKFMMYDFAYLLVA